MSSRRKSSSPPGDGAADIILFVIGLLVFGSYRLLRHLIDIPLETQLRQLERPPQWGMQIEAVNCPQCLAQNETGTEVCYQCGLILLPPYDPPSLRNIYVIYEKSKARFKVLPKAVKVVIYIVAFLVCYQLTMLIAFALSGS
jgi:hypothetical protein